MLAPDADIALMTAAAHEAGAIARRHFGNRPQVWDKGGGQGPVSVADLEVDAMLRARLLAARPGHGWLSEETEDDPARLAAAETFVVDPIDGTRAFIDGQPGFAHAIALVRDGRAVAAVVHLPMLDLTYSARLGGGAWLNGQRIQASTRADLAGARLLATRSMLAPEHWPGGVPAVDRHFRPSLAWRLCMVAEARYDATLTLRDAWHWDIAAAGLVAAEAGATVTDRTGAAIRYNTPVPSSPGVVVAPPPLHRDLMARLTAA